MKNFYGPHISSFSKQSLASNTLKYFPQMVMQKIITITPPSTEMDE